MLDSPFHQNVAGMSSLMYTLRRGGHYSTLSTVSTNQLLSTAINCVADRVSRHRVTIRMRSTPCHINIRTSLLYNPKGPEPPPPRPLLYKTPFVLRPPRHGTEPTPSPDAELRRLRASGGVALPTAWGGRRIGVFP